MAGALFTILMFFVLKFSETYCDRQSQFFIAESSFVELTNVRWMKRNNENKPNMITEEKLVSNAIFLQLNKLLFPPLAASARWNKRSNPTNTKVAFQRKQKYFALFVRPLHCFVTLSATAVFSSQAKVVFDP